jgi:hypothetical protein
MKQRRNFFRVLFKAPVSLRWDGGETGCEVCDLSLKGMLLRTPENVRLNPGATCTVVLPLDGVGDGITMEGVVAHHHGEVLGMHCTRIDLDSITHLRRLVELNSGDSAELQRELSALSPE